MEAIGASEARHILQNLGITQFYFLQKQGLIPKGISLTGGRKRSWIRHEIEAVVQARAIGATDQQVRELVQRLVADRARFAPPQLVQLPRGDGDLTPPPALPASPAPQPLPCTRNAGAESTAELQP